jgi:hypothetical protein
LPHSQSNPNPLLPHTFAPQPVHRYIAFTEYPLRFSPQMPPVETARESRLALQEMLFRIVHLARWNALSLALSVGLRVNPLPGFILCFLNRTECEGVYSDSK